jgi:HEAT repeat protein
MIAIEAPVVDEPPADGAVPAQGNERLLGLLARLSAATTPADATTVLEEIAFVAEQSSREGRTTDVADLFAAVLDRETAATDADIRRAYLMTARRLTKPTLLRPIATLVISEPGRAVQIERILQRCGQDGVDAVVDQYSGATSHVQRGAYREVLFRLESAKESLVKMLSDPRWHVVRQAADFLGEMGTPDAERPLAELLRHQDERVRRAATRALARIDSPFTMDALARAVTDDAPAVRLEAIAALAARKGPRAAATLAKAIDDEVDTEVQYSLVAALGRVGTPEGVHKLANAAAAASGLFKSKKNSGLRVAAVMALGEARTPAALAALQGLANDREKEVRDAVARVLTFSARGTAA